jgi:hypothetical protein
MLDGIWRAGDRDECSIKHIGHATAALAAGRAWTDGVDYSTPWGMPATYVQSRDDFVDWPPDMVARKEKDLAARWAKVTALRDELGADGFDQAVRGTKFAWYHEQNMSMYWADGGTS